jgi:PAS domain S-box-containing protein
MLAESEQRFRIMADCAPVMLWMAGTDGLCDFFNQGWLEFTGKSEEAERGTGWAEGVHPEDFQRCMHIYLDAFVERRAFRMEYRLRRADGDYRWILDQGVPRYTPDGHFAGYIGSCIDIDEQKQLQEELDSRVKLRTSELAATVQELEAFCYSISHDLRAPLRTIDGFGLALLEDSGHLLDGGGKDHLRRIRDAAQRMGQLMDDLLELSRLGRVALTRVPIDLSALARAVAVDLHGQQPDRTVTWMIRDGLSATGDPLLVRVVLENLLGNAWKFTGRAAHPIIELGSERSGSELVFYVQDNGVGFSMDYARDLFAPFQRLHSSADFPGSGIGLASVHRIVQRHGGRVWARSAEGEGARIGFTLPGAVPT